MRISNLSDLIIEDITSGMSETDLLTAVDELLNKDVKGIPDQGVTASICYRLTSEAGIDLNYVQDWFESFVFKEASKKWLLSREVSSSK